MPNTAKQSSVFQGWITPRDPYILAVEEVFDSPICLDPASSNEANQHVQASYFFDGVTVDGLEENWSRGAVELSVPRQTDRPLPDKWTVFLNPPYGRRYGKKGPFNTSLWIPRLVEEYSTGNVDEAILLVNASPGAAWYHALWSFPICFVDHRIKFYDPRIEAIKEDPTHFNTFVYLGAHPARFWAVFQKFGPVAKRVENSWPDVLLYDDVRYNLVMDDGQTEAGAGQIGARLDDVP